MDLSDVRQWLVDTTGRYNLQNGDGSDNGANKYIVAGSMMLDMMMFEQKSLAWDISSIAEGVYKKDLKLCRAVEEVWVSDTDGRTKLERKDLSYMREFYADLEANIDEGRPAYWAPIPSQMAPSIVGSLEAAFSSMYDYGMINFTDATQSIYDCIYLMPPADGTYTLNVLGMFFQKQMSADADINLWSVKYPHLLVRAATYMIELDYRNKAGQDAELAEINRNIILLDNDMVEREIAGINEMEG